MWDGINELIISEKKAKYSLSINCFKMLHCSSFRHLFSKYWPYVISKAKSRAPGYKDEHCTVLSSRVDRHITLSAIRQCHKCNDSNAWSIVENVSIAKLNEINTYECIKFFRLPYLFSVQRKLNNSIHIVEKVIQLLLSRPLSALIKSSEQVQRKEWRYLATEVKWILISYSSRIS